MSWGTQFKKYEKNHKQVKIVNIYNFLYLNYPNACNSKIMETNSLDALNWKSTKIHNFLYFSNGPNTSNSKTHEAHFLNASNLENIKTICLDAFNLKDYQTLTKQIISTFYAKLNQFWVIINQVILFKVT